jgi:hypothetical protein
MTNVIELSCFSIPKIGIVQNLPYPALAEMAYNTYVPPVAAQAMTELDHGILSLKRILFMKQAAGGIDAAF